MSHTDHPRPAKRPEHADRAPQHVSRPEPRRQRTRTQATRAAVRDANQNGA